MYAYEDQYNGNGGNEAEGRVVTKERKKKRQRKQPEEDDGGGGIGAAVVMDDRRSEEENYDPDGGRGKKSKRRQSSRREVEGEPEVGGEAEADEERRRRRKEKRRLRKQQELDAAAEAAQLAQEADERAGGNYPFEDDNDNDDDNGIEEMHQPRQQQRGYRQEPHQAPNERDYRDELEARHYEDEDYEDDEDEERPTTVDDATGSVEMAATPQPEPTKKKTGGFGKIFASFKRKGKKDKNSSQGSGSVRRSSAPNETWESTPELFNPAYDEEHSPNKKVGGRAVREAAQSNVHVILLDGEEVEMHVDKKALGQQLFDRVCESLDLVEKDFFGLTYVSKKMQTWFWLEFDKKISKQLGSGDELTFNFQVKFYPPEPVLLQEDLTRYLLCLQVRQDVYTGKLPCSWVTQALLGSLLVQSELGDWEPEEHQDAQQYLSEFEFVFGQSEQLLVKIGELHRKHAGTSPDKADLKYLETAKRLEQYGVDLHPARDNDDVEIFIGVCYTGVLIYRDRVRIGRFAWPKVLRISYKKNYFYLKIRSDRYDNSVAIVGFKLFNHNLAKRLWKNAVEQHSFFRMKEPQSAGLGRMSGSLLFMRPGAAGKHGASGGSGGNSYAYSGKTLHQYRSMNISRAGTPARFDRSMAKRRTIGSMPAGLNRAGVQYSSMHSLSRAHPRDMTMSKTKSVEYLAGGAGPNGKRAGSVSVLGGEPSDRQGSYDDYANLGRGAGRLEGLVPSVGGSMASSQQQQYRGYPAPPRTLSYMSGGGGGGGLDSLQGDSYAVRPDNQLVHEDDRVSLPPHVGSSMRRVASPDLVVPVERPDKKRRSPANVLPMPKTQPRAQRTKTPPSPQGSISSDGFSAASPLVQVPAQPISINHRHSSSRKKQQQQPVLDLSSPSMSPPSLNAQPHRHSSGKKKRQPQQQQYSSGSEDEFSPQRHQQKVMVLPPPPPPAVVQHPGYGYGDGEEEPVSSSLLLTLDHRQQQLPPQPSPPPSPLLLMQAPTVTATSSKTRPPPVKPKPAPPAVKPKPKMTGVAPRPTPQAANFKISGGAQLSGGVSAGLDYSSNDDML